MGILPLLNGLKSPVIYYKEKKCLVEPLGQNRFAVMNFKVYFG